MARKTTAPLPKGSGWASQGAIPGSLGPVSPKALLEQSASLMKGWLSGSTVIPDGLAEESLIDRKLALCLTGEGPKYLSVFERRPSQEFWRLPLCGVHLV